MTEYLDAKTEFVVALAARLEQELRILPSGAKSFAHLMIVVPTAMSGRRLRVALARRFGAVVAPTVVTPSHLVEPAGDSIATRTDEIIAFHEAAETGDDGLKPPLELSAQLSDVRRILGANALSFADVAAKIAGGDLLKGDLADLEIERWRRLAETEKRYLAALGRRGRIDRIEAMKGALADAAAPEGVEKVIVAGVLDPVALMEKALAALALPVERIEPQDTGLPLLAAAAVHPSGTSASEAEELAEYFSKVKPGEALPALCLADAEMFAEVKGAFQAKGLKVHDPSGTRLSTSSLGHLVTMIAALLRTSSYQVFSSFLRTGDVRRWVCEELGYDDGEFAAILTELDRRQQELLPERIQDIMPRTEKKLRNVFEFISVKLKKCGVRELLEQIFRRHTLDESDEESREFAAAAEAVNELIEECFAKDVPEELRWELFAMRLNEAVYELEPDAGEVILTDGWLELAYLEAKELVVAGLQEGAVPQSVVGHPFVPDSLRKALDLPCNETRYLRDRRLFATALKCREPGAVRISFHAVSAQGDVKKPSRLLFETADDAELIRRVKKFHGVRAGTSPAPAADLPKAWKLKLPVPPLYAELRRTSPTRFDVYWRCPFTAYLKEKSVLGDKRLDDRAEELPSWEFGNIAHSALEAWGDAVLDGSFTDHEDEAKLRAYFEEKVDWWLSERFGTAVPVIVAMQAESVKRRLANFARIQVGRYREGWRIRAAEQKLETKLGHTVFNGKCDRIDFNESTGKWCVIDYKTWDKADRALAYEEKKDGTRVWKSFQLPLYCSMLNVCKTPGLSGIALDDITAAYAVLGSTEENVVFSRPMEGAMAREAERELRTMIERFERGIFWPPAESERPEWLWDYKDWLSPNPKATVDEEWIADQERRIEAWNQEHGTGEVEA